MYAQKYYRKCANNDVRMCKEEQGSGTVGVVMCGHKAHCISALRLRCASRSCWRKGPPNRNTLATRLHPTGKDVVHCTVVKLSLGPKKVNWQNPAKKKLQSMGLGKKKLMLGFAVYKCCLAPAMPSLKCSLLAQRYQWHRVVSASETQHTGSRMVVDGSRW